MEPKKPKEIIVESPEFKRKKINKFLYIVIGLLVFILIFSKVVPLVLGLFFVLLKVILTAGIVYFVIRYLLKKR
jgi:hypothetical protein